jgi:hypothetical protein
MSQSLPAGGANDLDSRCNEAAANFPDAASHSQGTCTFFPGIESELLGPE